MDKQITLREGTETFIVAGYELKDDNFNEEDFNFEVRLDGEDF